MKNKNGCLLALLSGLISFNTIGKTSKVTLNFSNESVNESLELVSRTLANTYNRQTLYSRYDMMGINRKLDLGVGLTYTRTDYSKFYVRDSSANIVPLTSNNKKIYESSVDSSLLYQRGTWAYILGLGLPIDQTYFEQHSFNTGVIKSLYRKSTLLSLNYRKIIFNRPATYFRDPETFVIKAQARKISTDTLTFDWEQILSEKLKTKNGLGYTLESEERPSNIFGFTKWAFAITPTVFSKLNYRLAKEITSDELKNDRGHLTNHVFNAELSWEFIYDWIGSFSYSLVREDEYDPRTLAKRRTGVDQYGASLDYAAGKTLWSLAYSQTETNTKIKATQISLGLTWNF
jgi:hypothetical protein